MTFGNLVVISFIEEMEVVEQTELPCFPQVAVPVQPLETSTSANLQVSKIVMIFVSLMFIFSNL
jgi:hypothetical protein